MPAGATQRARAIILLSDADTVHSETHRGTTPKACAYGQLVHTPLTHLPCLGACLNVPSCPN